MYYVLACEGSEKPAITKDQLFTLDGIGAYAFTNPQCYFSFFCRLQTSLFSKRPLHPYASILSRVSVMNLSTNTSSDYRPLLLELQDKSKVLQGDPYFNYLYTDRSNSETRLGGRQIQMGAEIHYDTQLHAPVLGV